MTKIYENDYIVYDDGRIFSKKSNKFLKEQKKSNGYIYFHFFINGKVTNRYKHRILAECFLEKRDGCTEINHINGIKHDNRLENIEWVTSSENSIHAINTGLVKRFKKISCFLNDKKIKTFNSVKEASKHYNVDSSSISQCLRGKSKTSCGMKWRYE